MALKFNSYLHQIGIFTLAFCTTFACKKDTKDPEEENTEEVASDIVPKLISLSPDSAVLNAIPTTLRATFDVSMATPESSAIQISGDCAVLPTVAVTADDKVIKATLEDGSCGDGKSLMVTVNPKDFSSTLGVSGAGDAITKEFTIKTSGPIVSLSSPTKTLLNASASSTLTLTLTPSSLGGTTLTGALTESGGGISLTRVTGNPSCTIGASSLDITGATISLSNCSGNGTFTLHVDAAIAKDSLENTSAQSAESVEFTVDTTAPTLTSSKLTETSLGASSAALSWTAATDDRSTNLSYSVYKSAANPSTGSFASVVNAKAGTLVTSGTNLSSATISSGLSAGSSYYFNVIVADEAGNETAYQAIGDLFTSGLRLYYPFDGNSNDISSNANHGVRTNSPALANDRFGFASSAYSFVRASSQHIQSTDNVGISGKHDITMSLWFKGDGSNYSTTDRLLATGANTNNNLFGIYPDNGTFRVWVNNGMGDQDTGADCTSTSWKHLVVVYDTTLSGGGTRAYVNGVAQSYSGASNSFSLTNSPVIIAKAITNDTWATGTIDDVRVYDTALTATEISRLYAVTAP